MWEAWFTFVVWLGHKRGQITCAFEGHDWHNEVVCGYPGMTPRPLGIRCWRCARLAPATERDKPQNGTQ